MQSYVKLGVSGVSGVAGVAGSCI